MSQKESGPAANRAVPDYLTRLSPIGSAGIRNITSAAAPCELDDMHTALGRRVPRHERRRWEVAVIRYGTGIARTYARDGRVVAVQAIAADPAGAE